MNRHDITKWVEIWKSRGYSHDIPDQAPDIFEQENMAPSYRRICLAIMKNDIQLQSLGYNREPCQVYNVIKRAELKQRGVIKHCQMRLFDECL
jgi:predicted phosphoadenosine phosphosulfate sulfurtransferase